MSELIALFSEEKTPVIPMTVELIQKALERIELIKGDNEYAHGEEDSLYVNVLSAIAEGNCENPQECAREALKACEIEFTRWYA